MKHKAKWTLLIICLQSDLVKLHGEQNFLPSLGDGELSDSLHGKKWYWGLKIGVAVQEGKAMR
jgi:hypothetical protein